jgi:hypothetical protein
MLLKLEQNRIFWSAYQNGIYTVSISNLDAECDLWSMKIPNRKMLRVSCCSFHVAFSGLNPSILTLSCPYQCLSYPSYCVCVWGGGCVCACARACCRVQVLVVEHYKIILYWLYYNRTLYSRLTSLYAPHFGSQIITVSLQADCFIRSTFWESNVMVLL